MKPNNLTFHLLPYEVKTWFVQSTGRIWSIWLDSWGWNMLLWAAGTCAWTQFAQRYLHISASIFSSNMNWINQWAWCTGLQHIVGIWQECALLYEPLRPSCIVTHNALLSRDIYMHLCKSLTPPLVLWGNYSLHRSWCLHLHISVVQCIRHIDCLVSQRDGSSINMEAKQRTKMWKHKDRLFLNWGWQGFPFIECFFLFCFCIVQNNIVKVLLMRQPAAAHRNITWNFVGARLRDCRHTLPVHVWKLTDSKVLPGSWQ